MGEITCYGRNNLKWHGVRKVTRVNFTTFYQAFLHHGSFFKCILKNRFNRTIQFYYFLSSIRIRPKRLKNLVTFFRPFCFGSLFLLRAFPKKSKCFKQFIMTIFKAIGGGGGSRGIFTNLGFRFLLISRQSINPKRDWDTFFFQIQIDMV
jgi:hypothetical protein